MIVLRILLGLILGGGLAFASGFGVATLFEHVLGEPATPASHPAPAHTSGKPTPGTPTHSANQPAEKGTKR